MALLQPRARLPQRALGVDLRAVVVACSRRVDHPALGRRAAAARPAVLVAHIPRKPKELGGEVKDTADGECGAIIRVEYALKYKRHSSKPQVVAPYTAEWGATTAQCLRLVEPWLDTRRCFGADAHFISVVSCEGMLLKVRSEAAMLYLPYLTLPCPRALLK